MECRDVQNLLHPFVDGELDLVRHLQIEHHLADCTECADRERSLRQLREVLKAPELYHRAPDALRAKLRATLALAPAPAAEPNPTAPAAPPSTAAPTKRRRRTVSLPLATAAGIVLVVASLSVGALVARSARDEDQFAERVVAAHVRSLQVSHATDVVSSDRHTVKPWFQGKLDFAPQVPDLSAASFVLIGGRMDYLTDRPVAALVYQRRQHPINVFTWPNGNREKEQVARVLHRQGYHIRFWERAGMAFWAVSDLNDLELDEFVRAFQTTAGTSTP